MMKKTCLLLALLLSPQAFCDDLLQWTDTSVTVLYGDDYKLAPSDEQTTATIESAGAWKYGDWFLFHDFIHMDDSYGDSNTNYGEISPRFSASKILGQQVGYGAITDVSLALTYEHGEGDVESMLYGIGLDFKAPYFSYLQLNTYRRDANNNNSSGWQFTPVWRMDFPVGDSNIVFDGFMDWVFASDGDQGYKTNLHFNPQIKYDLGAIIFGAAQKNRLMVGIEYDYWKNKYGVDGVDQNTYSVIVKYHF